MKKIKKAIISSESSTFIFKNQDIHTKFGYIPANSIRKASPGTLLQTNTGKDFHLIDASFNDIYRKIKRGPQIIPLKDAALMISLTGISKSSRVAEAGSGSGALSCLLANIVKSVVTYEIRDDFADIAEHNFELLDLTNIKLKRKSIYDGLDEKNLDALFLDLPEPWLVIKPASKALKPGGYIVSYSPSIPQVMDFCQTIASSGLFTQPETLESILRYWEVLQRKTRPKSSPIGHSGFITISRFLGSSDSDENRCVDQDDKDKKGD